LIQYYIIGEGAQFFKNIGQSDKDAGSGSREHSAGISIALQIPGDTGKIHPVTEMVGILL
jgi:hypothetical protein